MKRTFATILAVSLSSFAFAQDATTAPAQKAPAQKAMEKAPTPEALLQKNMELMGGKDAWMKIKDITMKGEFVVTGAGMGGPLMIRQKAPNQQLTTINISGIGEIKEGFDGTNAWDLNPMTGPTLKKGVALEQAARSAKFSALLNPLEGLTDARHHRNHRIRRPTLLGGRSQGTGRRSEDVLLEGQRQHDRHVDDR